jgi:alpha-L-rhamnosidase
MLLKQGWPNMKFLTLASGVALSVYAASAGLAPGHLRCEYRINPMGMDEPQPRLEWVNAAGPGERGQRQTAWQIQVAADAKGLGTAGAAWDSGKVVSPESTQIAYGGQPLLPRQRYVWRVRVWDKADHASAWGAPAFFETGMLGRPWQAKWIGAPWQEEDGKKDADAAPLIRTGFELPPGIVQARAYVTGLGYFELYVNGQKVGDDVLTPAQTDYGKRESIKVGHPIDPVFSGHRVLYLTYDVTALLKPGANAVGAMLGNGWYNRHDGREGQLGFGAPRFLMELHVRFADGTEKVIASDGNWRTAKGPVEFNRIYEGEHYDARQEQPGWCAAGFDDRAWQPAALRKEPGGVLQAQPAPTDRVMEVIKPTSVVKLGEGRYRLSFPEEISGWLRFRVKGPAGQKVEVRWLAQDTTEKQDYNGKNSYTLKGGGEETYAPRFTWFVFKDVELIGWPGDLMPESVQAEAVYTGVETTGRFACSNPLFDKIDRLYWRSQTDNLHGALSSDCPHRERLGYTGDGQASCVTAIHHFDLAAFYTKWVQDYFDAQHPVSGYVTDTAPFEGGGGGPEWGAACILVPWQAYLHYGDKRILERHYAGMKHFLSWMHSLAGSDGTLFCKLPDGKDTFWLNLGDWCAPDKKQPPRDLVHTFYLWRCTDFMARIATAQGLEGDACTYRALADKTAAAFHAKFYDAGKGSYGPVGGNVFALAMGVPQERLARVRQALAADIAANGGHLDTGIFGTGFLFEVLCDNGMNDLAYSMMDQRTKPSFGWWIEQGWTTTSEYWEGEGSRNHPMFGGGLAWFYRRLAGFEADETAPGYRRILIRPRPVGGATQAAYATRTPYGEASVAWKVTGDVFELKTVVPVGATAHVALPKAVAEHVAEGGRSLAQAEGVKVVGVEDGALVLEVGSGSYGFVVTPDRK